jgi:predicted nucleic acid-binding protein
MGQPVLKYLLDSVIVIDHFNGIEPATAFLAEQGSECALSAITRAEVLVGFDDDSEPLALVPLQGDFDMFRTPVRCKHKAPRPQA